VGLLYSWLTKRCMVHTCASWFKHPDEPSFLLSLLRDQIQSHYNCVNNSSDVGIIERS
jgi:hypothetical protein